MVCIALWFILLTELIFIIPLLQTKLYQIPQYSRNFWQRNDNKHSPIFLPASMNPKHSEKRGRLRLRKQTITYKTSKEAHTDVEYTTFLINKWLSTKIVMIIKTTILISFHNFHVLSSHCVIVCVHILFIFGLCNCLLLTCKEQFQTQ